MTYKGSDIKEEYFEWLYNMMYSKKRMRKVSYKELLWFLHCTEFRYTIERDGNRAADGVDLRYRFARERGYNDISELSDPCSVLEMLIALAIRCEDHIMYDPDIGDRTTHWFWLMLKNIGLYPFMSDDEFDEELVDTNVTIFLDRDYSPNGEGGLFTIEDCGCDMRTMEIWYQACWYFDTFLGV